MTGRLEQVIGAGVAIGAVATMAHGQACDVPFGAGALSPLGKGPSSIACADFDGDGHTDIAAAGLPHIALLRGDGAGSFGDAEILAPGVSATRVIAADVDGDGDVDLIAGGASVRVLDNDGTGVLTSVQSLSASGTPTAYAYADVTGDGVADVLATAVRFGMAPDDLVVVFPGDGRGGFGAGVEHAVGAEWPVAIDVGDLDHDGSPDVVVGRNPGGLTILLADGVGEFNEPMHVPLGGGVTSVLVEDVDGDGSLDVLAGVFNGGGTHVLLGDGAGGLVPGQVLVGAGDPGETILGDVNHDGLDDLVIADETYPGGLMTELHLGLGAGAFEPVPISLPSEGFLYAGLAGTGAIADFDEDGSPDLAIGELFEKGVVVMLNLCDAPACAADCNADGELNVLDFVCFQGMWQGQEPAGDCDGNGVFDVLDFVCFQQLFVGGCP